MTASDFVTQRRSTASRKDIEEEEEREEGYCSSVVGEGNEKTEKKSKNQSASRRFRCLSRRASNIIGLPKRPDTKFRKQEFYARIRSSIARKCRKSGMPLFSGVSREDTVKSKDGNNSFKSYEPGSPYVSCLGRIKLKQKQLNTLTSGRHEDRGPRKGRFSWLKKLFAGSRRRKKVGGSNRGGGHEFYCGDDVEVEVEVESSRASLSSCPPLSQLKRFASQREPDALANFSVDDLDAGPAEEVAVKLSAEDNEVKKEAQPAVCDKKGLPLNSESGKADTDVVGLDIYEQKINGRLSTSISLSIPFSEVNLWKRRSLPLPPPMALRLKKRDGFGFGFDMRKPLTV